MTQPAAPATLQTIANQGLRTYQQLEKLTHLYGELSGQVAGLTSKVDHLDDCFDALRRGTPPAPRPAQKGDRDLTRIARRAARREWEEITGRHKMSELELDAAVRKRRLRRAVNFAVHIVSGVLIAVLTVLLLGHMPSTH